MVFLDFINQWAPHLYSRAASKKKGEPVGSLYCGLVIALTMERVRRKHEEFSGLGV